MFEAIVSQRDYTLDIPRWPYNIIFNNFNKNYVITRKSRENLQYVKIFDYPGNGPKVIILNKFY